MFPVHTLRSTWTVPTVISKDFPYLEGHFPRNPIVPGVAILDKSLDLIREYVGKTNIQLCEIKSAKFLAPLEPGSELVIDFQEQENQQWSVEWSLISKNPDVAPQKVVKLVLTLSEAIPRQERIHPEGF